MPIFQKNPEKSVSGLLKRMDQAMAMSTFGPMYENKDNDPTVKEFKEIRQKLEKMKKELGQANIWERNVMYGYFELVKHVQSFCAAGLNKELNMDSKLQLIHKSAEDLQNYISLIQLKDPSDADQETTDSDACFQLRPPEAWKMSQEWLELGVEKAIHDSSRTTILSNLRSYEYLEQLETRLPDSSRTTILSNLRRSYEYLEQLETRLCLLCLSIFPDHTVLKKRLLIYWWIGEGIITDHKESDSQDYKTAEEVGDDIFDELISDGLIAAVKDGSCPSCKNKSKHCFPVVNRCKMNPWIRDMLVSVAREADFFDFDPSGKPSDSFSTSGRSCLVLGNQNFSPSASSSSSRDGNGVERLMTVFNVSEEILGFRADWLAKLRKIAVLQLGRWHYWCEHHIEVENDEQLFKGLGSQKLLKYLSIRGISRIFTLPSSIAGLVNLEILDLKACHNLESLPDISSLRKLTHLDMSECHLLEAMPKGISKLTSLQVLKGFVIGNSARNTSKLRDLEKLKKLRRLSIYLGRDAAVREDECDTLKEISSLRCLTIIWGANAKKLNQEPKEPLSFSLSLPENLKKLDLRGFPQDKAPAWLKPSGLKMLEKLYIRGGELKSLELDQGETESWRVEILRLKFMRSFDMGFAQLKDTFPRLRYLERIECHTKGPIYEKECCHRNIVWSKDADEEEEKRSIEDNARPEGKAEEDEEECNVEDIVRPEGSVHMEECCDEDNLLPECAAVEGEITPIP